MTAQHTPGPWRWELNQKAKSLQLVGGLRPKYDLTIIQPIRWGMGSATLFLRDTSPEGFNLLHKLHERPDWIAPFPGRDHHAKWCADVTHPDMRLIAAAPDLLAALTSLYKAYCSAMSSEFDFPGNPWTPERDNDAAALSARAAIQKATKEQV